MDSNSDSLDIYSVMKIFYLHRDIGAAQIDFEKDCDEFKNIIGTAERYKFVYLIDSFERAAASEIELSNDWVSASVMEFLKYFLTGNLENKMELCHEKLININVEEVMSLFQWVMTRVNDKMLENINNCTKVMTRINIKEKSINEKLKYAGLSGFALHYDDIKKEEDIAKNSWLLLVISVGMVVLICIGESLYGFFHSDSFELNKSIFKAIYIFSFLAIFFWLGRQYSFSKKQFSIYRHLASAISSYTLIEESLSSNDSELKKALLCEVSKTLFPLPDCKVADTHQLPLLQILDLAKEVVKKDKSSSAG